MSPGDCQPNSPASSTWFMEYLKEHPDNQEYYLHLSEIANK
ncbi:hypothetical protein EDC28_105119 [Gallaecimonas pentaromativorans]|uniref:Uncharacterized protein n=2 Tax=Gallaecimonas pentaromativorans TaxID=584787 RepID=A0A3N1PG15_9GAMM|nr:hypothetical protein EDC28_105119 [Gallaecimonas pentaromativorans]